MNREKTEGKKMERHTKHGFISFRIDPEDKQKAEVIIRNLGLTPKIVVSMLYKQIIREGRWPFNSDIRDISPNKIEEKEA
jgi:addiction module RelB/DinJ family antitoxin